MRYSAVAVPSPSPSGSIPGSKALHDATDVVAPHTTACEHNSVLCRVFYNVSGNRGAAKFIDDWLPGPVNLVVTVALIVLVAIVVRRLASRLILKVTNRMADGSTATDPHLLRFAIFEGSSLVANERRRQRAETTGHLLNNIASVLIISIAALEILARLGLNIVPLLASASIVGVGVAFGAQSLVKDFLSGIFMLLEDQYGVGDTVDTGNVKGVVESVTLRITRIRDKAGTIWYVRNGNITRLGNHSKGWSRAVVDIPVAAREDMARVESTLMTAARAFTDDPVWSALLDGEPTVTGIELLSGEAMVVRLACQTTPGHDADVARELRIRVKQAFDAAEIALAPFPATDPAT